jgi:hypothetical protein
VSVSAFAAYPTLSPGQARGSGSAGVVASNVDGSACGNGSLLPDTNSDTLPSFEASTLLLCREGYLPL